MPITYMLENVISVDIMK